LLGRRERWAPEERLISTLRLSTVATLKTCRKKQGINEEHHVHHDKTAWHILAAEAKEGYTDFFRL
jgi:hypothetical protein